jgi:hypothetical protein
LKSFAYSLIALAFIPSAIVAQSNPAGDTIVNALLPVQKSANALQCELHAWPGPGLGSIFHGWWHGGIVDGAIKGRQGYTPISVNPIETSEQASLLAKTNLSELLKLSDYKQIVHDESLGSTVIRSASGRLSESISPCYAELIVEKVMFQEDMVNGRSFKILVRFRKFGASQTVERLFGTWAQSPVKLFPAENQEDAEAASNEIRTAYLSNISIFAGYLNNPVKSKAGRTKATNGGK